MSDKKPTKSVMTKKVNIVAPIPIRTVNPTIFGRYEGITMTPANILKCLIGRATVHEVLSDGSLVKLTDRNYNKVNTPPVKYPEHKEIAKQQSAVGKNSFSRKKPQQADAMSKDLRSFVDSKFIPQSTNPEKTFHTAPQVTGDESKSINQAITEEIPGYLKNIDKAISEKEIIPDSVVKAAQESAQEMIDKIGTPDQPEEEDPAAHPGPDGGTEVLQVEVKDQHKDKEAAMRSASDEELIQMIRDELTSVKIYDFNSPVDDAKWRAEAKRLMMEIGGYNEELAEKISMEMTIIQPDKPEGEE